MISPRPHAAVPGRRRARIALSAALGASVSLGSAVAQTPPGVQPFDDFVASLHATSAAQMAAPALAGRRSGVASAAAAEEMRQHLLGLYDGVSVRHSFAQSSQVFDCVPIDQQPSLRRLGLHGAATPPTLAPETTTPQGHRGGPRALPGTQRDSGASAQSEQSCVAGTIPMRRITLDEITRFGSLQQFFQKGPGGAGQFHKEGLNGGTPPSQNGHTYAHEYQYVNNYGGWSTLSLYRPYVNTSVSEVFSLSQQWYVGFGSSGVQTAEIGIQNYPAKYGSENSALFIYYTADGYQHTGCYNLECGAFVQTNSDWHLGGGFSNYSTVGGSQYEVALGFYLYNGNWWMAAGSDWVGYYPGSLYNGGPMSRYAQEFDLGGESVGSYIWPNMGSGQYASAGWPRAAYHRAILYRNSANAGYAPSLTVSQSWPSCQTASTATYGGSTWQTYFFFGGPGGYNC